MRDNSLRSGGSTGNSSWSSTPPLMRYTKDDYKFRKYFSSQDKDAPRIDLTSSLRFLKQNTPKIETSLLPNFIPTFPSSNTSSDDNAAPQMAASNGSDHFPSFDERVRASSRHVTRSGRISPTHSAHCGLFSRSSILQVSAEKRAKKVRFYRNGDLFFKGMIYAVSPERFRTFESLLAELTSGPLGDKVVLPHGVRHIFSIDGSKKVTTLDDLEEGESYVCASTQSFKQVDYPRSYTPSWIPGRVSRAAGLPLTERSSFPQEDENDREYIKPKLITIVGNGTKPRKAVRILLNKKTAHSFDQVMTDITDAIKLDTGAVRKIYTLAGAQVTCLQDFFREDSVFVAYGNEKYSLDDFDVDDNEVRFTSAYKSVRNKERITLRSPKAPRRLPLSISASSSRSSLQDVDATSRRSSKSSSGIQSPKSQRKNFASIGPRVNAGQTNGHTQNEHAAAKKPPKGLAANYKIGKVIGEGNFAIVKECSDKALRKPFALKVIEKEKCRGRESMIENEVSILRRVKHENIIQLIEEFNTPDAHYLIMELVTGGDLFAAISASTKYTERDASGMVYNLACAINYLHSLVLVHRDIKPENILVHEHKDGSKSLKLGDFGLATDASKPLYVVCGTPTYVAPEVLAETGYGMKVDVWSTGVIMYILLCGFPPFASIDNDQEKLFDLILAGKYAFTAPFWDDISDSAKDLISHMLDIDVDVRYDAQQVLNHPWVSEDMAKDYDMHSSISRGIAANFSHSKADQAVALIASTALDKQDGYFIGRKSQHSEETKDEVF